MAEAVPSFRERLLGGAPLLGTFVKTAAAQGIEILASAGLDFAVIDQEHAPLGRESVDILVLAARAVGMPVLVRVANRAEIGHALDSGADGVIVPHVASADEARSAAAACRYANGARGYSNSPRAGNYGGVAMAAHVAAQDADALVVCMIEDRAGVSHADAILAVPGIDAVLIGCADLAVTLGVLSTDAAELRAAVSRVAQAAAANGRRMLAPAASVQSADWLLGLGIDALVVGSDQSFLRAGAAATAHDFARHRTKNERAA